MSTTDKVKKYILDNPSMSNEDLAAGCNSTKFFVNKCKGELRKEGKLDKPAVNWRRKEEKIKTPAKILLLDIETAPIQAYTWGIWKQNIALNQIKHDWFCLTWAAKWLFENKAYSAKLTKKEVLQKDDKRIMTSLWSMLNEADIVIAHNGTDFDVPKINSRFLVHGMMPPLPYLQIDTLKHIRKQFGFTSNKLDYINKILGLPQKKGNEDGFELWAKVYEGDQDAMDKMEKYNINDVRILEDLYLRIRAWIKPHPSIGLHILDEGQCRCPTCGSDKLKDESKSYHTAVNIYDLLRCENCSAVSRRRSSAINIKQRRHLTISTPK